jgi:hypothetical protein
MTFRRQKRNGWCLVSALALRVFAVLLVLATPAAAQNPLNVNLSGTTTALPFREYATRELGDPWDMSERTDIGWLTWGVDSPPHNLSTLGMSVDANNNFYFTAQTATASPSFFTLDSWQPGTGKLGKIGVNQPIDTTVYDVLYVKMKIANSVLSFSTPPVAQVFWSRDTIYYNTPDHPAASHPFGGTMVATTSGGTPIGIFLTPCLSGQPACRLEGGNWVVYRIPLTIPKMQSVRPDADHWQNFNGGSSANWGDPGVTADSLRFQPFNIPGTDVGQFQIDWMRLVDENTGNTTSVTWTGGNTYDVVVSTQSDCSDFSVIGYSRSSGFAFQSQMLPPGNYYVGLRAPFTNSAPPTTVVSCSTDTFTVQSYPSLSLTSPHPEGSTDDFATTVLGNAWNFDSPFDVDFARNVTFPDGTFGLVSRAATDLAGHDLGSVAMYRNRSAAAVPGNVGDPHIYPLWPIPSPPSPPGTQARGQFKRIDTSKYRILTAEAGVERMRDLVGGSVARIIWHVDGDYKPGNIIAETESADIVLRHLDPAQNNGKLTLDTLRIDMADRATLPVESDTPQSASGWANICQSSAVSTCNPQQNPNYQPGVDLFRFDFHEFSDPTNSYLTRLKLAALQHTATSFQIQWTSANPSSLSSTVTLKAVPVADAANKNYRPSDLTCSAGGSVTIASGLAIGAGSYTWTPASTPGLVHGNEYYVCAQILVSGVSGAVDEVLSQWPIIVETLPASPLSVSPSSLRFAATKSGSTLTGVTSAQAVSVSGPAVAWTATPNQQWLQVSNGAGTGAGQFLVSVVNPGDVIGSNTVLNGSVTLNSPGVAPLTVTVILTIDHSGSTATVPPFGLVDTPVLPATGLVGAIGVTGWALDDIGLSVVKIYRNCLSFEPQTNCVLVGGISVVFVGDATFVAGARPDIEAAYPAYPQANRAAWGYLLLTNMLPNVPASQMFGGQGTLTLYVRAHDTEGKEAWLGRAFLPGSSTQTDTTPTQITLNNNNIAKPFGGIDTPAQGQVVSGTIANFGWTLTPDSNTVADGGTDIVVPTDGSTLRLYIDGVPGPTIAYNQCRGTVSGPVAPGVFCDDDVANIFGNPTPLPPFTTRTANPTRFRNLDQGRGAIGALLIDTTAYSNGVHTIMWGVTDTQGRGEGLGSRFFGVLNTSSLTAGSVSMLAPAKRSAARQALEQLFEASAVPLADASSVTSLPVTEGIVTGRTGFNLRSPHVELQPGPDGLRRVRLPEFGRLELKLGPVDAGYLVANGELRSLPPGSKLDAQTGQFTWAPGLAFIGTYRLTFVRGAASTSGMPTGSSERIDIDVSIWPERQENPRENAIRMHIDTPSANTTVSRSFTMSGWALDTRADIGSGIDAIHVWATRVDIPRAEPQFLGAAAINGSRPDIAAVFGSQFDRAGFALTVPNLPRGVYEITAYVWNRRTARWEDARTVHVTVPR